MSTTEALQRLLDRYTSLVNSGDAGNWDPEKESEVIGARAALAAAAPSPAVELTQAEHDVMGRALRRSVKIVTASADEAASRRQFEAFHAGRKNRGAKHRAEMFKQMEDGSYADESEARHWWTWQTAVAFALDVLADSPAAPDAQPAPSEPELSRLVKCSACESGCRGRCKKEPPLTPSGRFPGGLIGEPALRVARITLNGATLTVPADQLTALGLGEDDTANTYTLTFATMTRAAFEALGEFDGF